MQGLNWLYFDLNSYFATIEQQVDLPHLEENRSLLFPCSLTLPAILPLAMKLN